MPFSNGAKVDCGRLFTDTHNHVCRIQVRPLVPRSHVISISCSSLYWGAESSPGPLVQTDYRSREKSLVCQWKTAIPQITDETNGCFHSKKTSGLNFRKFTVTKWKAHSGIQKKKNLTRYTEMFRNFLPEISVPFDFSHLRSGILLNGSLFRNSKMSGFFGDFPSSFPYHL